MGKKDRNQNKGNNVSEEQKELNVQENETIDPIDTVQSETEKVDETTGNTENQEKIDEPIITPEETVENKEDETKSSDEPEKVIEEEPKRKGDTFSLTEAIEFSKNNSTEDLLDKVFKESSIDLKVFAAELKDIIAAYNLKSENDTNNGNRKLNSLLLRTLKIEDASDFKFRFDVINRLFKDNEFFQPVTLLSCVNWTKSEKDLSTFSQVITIIEDLADRETRNENKKRIANLSNLNLDEVSIANIKKYYKL